MKTEDINRAMDKAESLAEKFFILLIDVPKPFTAIFALYFVGRIFFDVIGLLKAFP